MVEQHDNKLECVNILLIMIKTVSACELIKDMWKRGYELLCLYRINRTRRIRG